MPRPLLACAAAVACLALAAPAGAQVGSGLTLGEDTTSQTAAPVDTSATTSGDDGLESWQQALIFAAGLALLAGIAFAILGDARERTRGARTGVRGAAGGPAAGDADGVEGGHRGREHAKQRARAKAKAARAQRRRNR